MTLLLVLLVATIFLFPVLAPAFGDRSRAAFDVVYVLLLLAGALAIGEHRGTAALAAALALAATAAVWLPLPLPEGTRRVGHQIASLATVAMIAAVIARSIFAMRLNDQFLANRGAMRPSRCSDSCATFSTRVVM